MIRELALRVGARLKPSFSDMDVGNLMLTSDVLSLNVFLESSYPPHKAGLLVQLVKLMLVTPVVHRVVLTTKLLIKIPADVSEKAEDDLTNTWAPDTHV